MEEAPFVSNDGVLLEEPQDEIWVRSGDNVQALADDIDFTMAGRGYVNLACIGAGAVNQAVKALAVAREIAALEHSYSLVAQPYFSNITDDQDRKRTRMMLRVTANAL